ncbi:hypothetical protein [Varibaculum cambriense]|uniref:hypothetical protein n=1 Tax=Varibaculum cambriense TaxID=184870 RepID=UPI00241EC7D1|nr:hypothetical protein [Varibaculum cambriense]MBS5945046.1 hypothetical protein [Varibaculum cambriense]
MFIRLDEKFTDQAGNTYEVENPVDNHYITYLYDEDGENVIARSDESEDFPKFYKRGWTKQECHDSLKADWVIQKDWQQHVEDLEALLDFDQISWLNLDEWDYLPTVQAFEDWLGTDFLDAWDHELTPAEEEDVNAASVYIIEACKRLDKAMEEDPSLIQATKK